MVILKSSWKDYVLHEKSKTIRRSNNNNKKSNYKNALEQKNSPNKTHEQD